MILLYLYMYALYAGDSAMAGRRTSLVLVSTVSNNPVGNRQSTFMDMSAAKKKDSCSSSFSPFFFGSRKKEKRKKESGIEDGWFCARYVHPMCAIQFILESVIKGPVYLPTNPTALLKQTCTLCPLHTAHAPQLWTYNTGNGLF